MKELTPNAAEWKTNDGCDPVVLPVAKCTGIPENILGGLTFLSGATMRKVRHIHRDDLMSRDPLSQTVLVVGLIGVVSLLIILIQPFRL